MTRNALPKKPVIGVAGCTGSILSPSITPNYEPLLVGPRPCRSIPRLCLAVLVALGCNSPTKAQQPPSSNAASSVLDAPLHRRTVRVPVTEGPDIRFRRLSAAAGLSQTRAEQIVQDDQGFMWLGTQFGLNRYDGNSFRVFTPN